MYLGGLSFAEYRVTEETAGRELLDRLWKLHMDERKADWEFTVELTTAAVKAITMTLSHIADSQTRMLAAALTR